ncbi:hypothetical protein D1007_26516 [Hordeum vulgare]|nr:hypothetical protein D1007_26516 [Hordeum vulgare]
MLDLETDMGKELDVDMGSPICTSVVPMSVHLDYCSGQLRKFDMLESDEEEVGMMPKMQCLAKEISIALGSTKRSLLDTLEKEAGQEKKINAGKDGRWGPLLNNKPKTREHGGVKIMDKAAAYMQKKNLEIPATSKGDNEAEQLGIISDMIDEEKFKGIQFANINPEIVLPDNLDMVRGLVESDSRHNSPSTSGGTAGGGES